MDAHDELDPKVLRARHPTRDPAEAAGHPSPRPADPPTSAQAQLLGLQRLAGNASVSRLIAPDDEGGPAAQRSSVMDVVGSGGGQPLEPGLRRDMEDRLGADFADVRVHTDERASESARSINAQAYTVGSDVVFRSDRWSPSSADGQRTLAHELTHVAQQRAGPVSGTPVGGGVSVSDPSDVFEQAAERSADAAMARSAGLASAPAQALPAQRQEEPEEEDELQALPAQRQEEPEEEEELQALPAQRQEEPEEEEELQALPAQRQEEPEEEDELQALPAQRQEEPEEEEELQALPAQRQEEPEEEEELQALPAQRQEEPELGDIDLAAG